jgi:hypothetical protein
MQCAFDIHNLSPPFLITWKWAVSCVLFWLSCDCLLFHSISVPKIQSTPNSIWSSLPVSGDILRVFLHVCRRHRIFNMFNNFCHEWRFLPSVRTGKANSVQYYATTHTYSATVISKTQVLRMRIRIILWAVRFSCAHTWRKRHSCQKLFSAEKISKRHCTLGGNLLTQVDTSEITIIMITTLYLLRMNR